VSPGLADSDLSNEDRAFCWARTDTKRAILDTKDTVFVAVVYPGVGPKRLSVVLKTRTGQTLVGPKMAIVIGRGEREASRACANR